MAQSPRTEPTSVTSGPATQADGLGGAMAQSRLFTDMAGTFGTELFRFASRRMQAQAELLAGLWQCRTVQEMLERQMEFVCRAGTDYAEQFGTMAQLAQSPAQPKQPGVGDRPRGNAD